MLSVHGLGHEGVLQAGELIDCGERVPLRVALRHVDSYPQLV